MDALPLTESTFLIMVSLSAAPKHGYAILKEVEELSAGRVTLSTGTLYGAIRRLLTSSWIERAEDITDDTMRNAKAYRLTEQGRRVLQAEVNRMRTLVTLAEQVVTS